MKYFSPISPVSSGSPPLQSQPIVAPTANAADTSTPQPTKSVAVSNPQDLQDYLDSALKNSAYKAEINMEHGGYTVLKVVDSDTGQTILQMPTQTVLDLISNMEQQDLVAKGVSSTMAASIINQTA